ncbi:MAG: hypothetical protein QOE46_2602 [Acidobacteriota bacterium]|jgi:hypothetical protein|nr:hypothetical protein [Acidobacteriota bacterium]
MKLSRLVLVWCVLPLAAASLAGCSSDMNANTGANSNSNAASPTPAVQTLSVVERPQKIKDQMTARGDQDTASPSLKIVEPKEGSTVNGSTVKLDLQLAGDLKGYEPHKDPATGMGNHIHVILDNQPYEAYYNIHEPFELRNVAEGAHTIRVFASRPWHESYKNDGSFQMVSFTVKGGGDASQPTTTNGGQKMADKNLDYGVNMNAHTANKNANAAASPAATPEGKEMQPSTGGAVDRTKPLLTYSRPKGEYKGADTDAVMIDFWLTNALLTNDDPNGRVMYQGGPFRVRYSVDGGEPKFIDKWEPIWLTGWTAGKHTVKLELVDKDGNVVDNGGYNSTSRDITITK